MIDNVVSLKDFSKKKMAHDGMVRVPLFESPADTLLMDLPMQLDLYKDRCWKLRGEGNPDGINIHRLLGLVDKMFAGICFPLAEPVSIQVFKDPKETVVFRVRVLSAVLEEMKIETDGGEKSSPLFVADLYFFEMENDDKELFFEEPAVHAGDVVDPESIPMGFFEGDRFPEQKSKLVIRNMNEIASDNCGFGQVADDYYVVVIPHSDRYCILLTLRLKDTRPTDGVV